MGQYFDIVLGVRCWCLDKSTPSHLWFDEILSEYVAAQPSFTAICRTIAAHADASPPLFHLITKLSGTALGRNEFGIRFPAMARYLLMMLCIYFIVRRYASPLYALIAVFSSYFTDLGGIRCATDDTSWMEGPAPRQQGLSRNPSHADRVAVGSTV